MSQPRVVHVDIQGQRYAIKTALEPKYVTDVAAYVDAKLDLAGRELTTTDSVRIAVVAALNIADELFRTRSETSDGRLQARAFEIERMVDAALESAAKTTSRAAR